MTHLEIIQERYPQAIVCVGWYLCGIVATLNGIRTGTTIQHITSSKKTPFMKVGELDRNKNMKKQNRKTNTTIITPQDFVNLFKDAPTGTVKCCCQQQDFV